MAAASGIEASPKSSPDMGKMQAMQDPMVVVTKSRRGQPARSIIAGQKGLTVDQIVDLQRTLPANPNYGPGVYAFEVSDAAGEGGVVKWTAQLGVDQEAAASNMNGASMMGVPMQPQVNGTAVGQDLNGMPVGSVQIAPGWFHNERLGLLIDSRPGGTGIHKWRPDMPLPIGAPGSGVSAPTAAAPATPLPGLQNLVFPGQQGWGAPFGHMPFGPPPADPKHDADERIKMLETRLLEAREESREAARRRELDEMRLAFDRAQEAANQRMEKLIETMSKKDTGPSSAELQMKQELAALRQEQEARRREEEAQRRHEAEMRATEAKFETLVRELKDSRPDPFISLMPSLMTSQSDSMKAVVAAIEKSATAASESGRDHMRLMSERLATSSLTPERMIELIRLSKDNGAMTESMNDMFKTLVGMTTSLIQAQAEMASGQNESPWITAAREASAGLGKVAQLYVMNKAQADARLESQQKEAARRAPPFTLQPGVALLSPPPQASGAAPQQVQPQRAPAPAAAPARAAEPAPPPKSESEKTRDAAALHVFGAPKASQTARDALAEQVYPTAKSKPVKVAPAPTPAPAPVPPAAPPAAPPAGVPDLSQMDEGDIRALTGQFDDDVFFGAVLTQVAVLREQVARGEMTPKSVIEVVGQAMDFLTGAGEFPPAVEIIQSGHMAVVVDRLIPSAPADFRAEVARLLDEEYVEEEEAPGLS